MNLRSLYMGFTFLMCSGSAFAQTPSAMDYLQALAGNKGIGARAAGTEEEQRTAEYIEQQWLNQGLLPYSSSFIIKDETLSKNISVDIKGKSDKTLIIAAHYDSTGLKEGSLGVTDNASSIAALLALSQKLQDENLPLSVRLIAFGAEEIGLLGAKAYVQQLSDKELAKIVGMINLDTIVGGDHLYIHSAHVKAYECGGTETRYSHDVTLRDALLNQAQSSFASNPFALHPAFPDYPQGVTGGWSDHAPFACAGLPIAYIEATNFSINGKNGFDGYSQSTHPALWDCFAEKDMTACNRETETKWGSIWHTEFDRLDKLMPLFGQRIEWQLEQTVKLLSDYVVNHQ